MAKEPIKPPMPASAPTPQPQTPQERIENSDIPEVLAKELEAMKKELFALKDMEKRRQLIMRRLAAAILTPPDEADKGTARKQTLRNNMLALVDMFAPEE